jgi:hypothetical protein
VHEVERFQQQPAALEQRGRSPRRFCRLSNTNTPAARSTRPWLWRPISPSWSGARRSPARRLFRTPSRAVESAAPDDVGTHHRNAAGRADGSARHRDMASRENGSPRLATRVGDCQGIAAHCQDGASIIQDERHCCVAATRVWKSATRAEAAGAATATRPPSPATDTSAGAAGSGVPLGRAAGVAGASCYRSPPLCACSAAIRVG